MLMRKGMQERRRWQILGMLHLDYSHADVFDYVPWMQDEHKP